MPSSTLAQKYKINGVVNTENPVLQNLEELAISSGCFITYDTQQGKWGVVINTAASSVASFDDTNIIGPINITTTSMFDLYNQIEVEYPLLDTLDKTDYVRINTSNAERSINEPDNLMKMTLNYCTEPVQAYLLGNIQLNQSRLDKVAVFETDYSALALNAGEVITITNDLYQFTNKTFRIITIKEIDGSDGDLRSEITALEYDAAIYDNTTIPRSVRTDLTGIQTLGAMTAPTVSITKTEASARPFISVISSVPNGVIEGVECWISSDGTNYNLRETIKNADTTLTSGGSVTFEFDDQPAGNVYAKTRGTNYSVAGPFSNVATTVYAPQQITNAIGNNTSVLNSSGATLSLLLAVPSLLKALDTFMNGSTTALNSVAKTQSVVYTVSNADCVTKLNAMTAGYTLASGYNNTNVLTPANWISVNFTTTTAFDIISIDLQTPLVNSEYDYEDQSSIAQTGSLTSQPTLGIGLLTGNTLATATEVIGSTIDWTNNFSKISYANAPAGNYFIMAYTIPTYALNMNYPRSLGAGDESKIFQYNFSSPGAGTPAGFAATVDFVKYG